MSDKLTSGYEQIEEDNIQKSIVNFLENREQRATFDTVNTAEQTESVDELSDPRIVAAEKMAQSVGFSMEVGQYLDLIK